ncbi:MAG: transposase, partial [Candidatus Riflebacteria bacterium]|nr:transposase [Candidatus Riflebacteria bacterium]
RDEYPVRATWNSILAGVVYQHPSIAALRRDLRRNAELRKECGFGPRLGLAAVPTDSAYSNLLSNILNHEPIVREMFHCLVEKLKALVPDLGKFMAHDGKALPSLAKGPKKDETGKTDQEPKSGSPSDQSGAGGADQQGPADKTATPATAESQEDEEDRRSESDATWGVKTYRGKRKDGTAWEKVVKWFGFELHLLVDSEHEMPINYKVTTASAPETTELLPLLQETKDLHPEIVASCEELSADKGFDSEKDIRGRRVGRRPSSCYTPVQRSARSRQSPPRGPRDDRTTWSRQAHRGPRLL